MRYVLSERDRTRFESKVLRGEDCWLWSGAHFTTTGYTVFNVKCDDGKWRPTVGHRVSYEIARGPIPEGLTIDHLCRNRACVNPSHMEAVTIGVNVLRADSPMAQQARWTECPKGHPFTDENTYRRASGKRECRACIRERESQRKRPKLTRPVRTHCKNGHELTDETSWVTGKSGMRMCRSCHSTRLQTEWRSGQRG